MTFTNTLYEGYKNYCIFTMRDKRITLLTHNATFRKKNGNVY